MDKMLGEARSANRMVMRNRFLRAAVEMVLERHTATPPEGELTPATNSKEPHGSNGATPIVGNCYVADTRNENDERPGKAAWFAFSLFATNTQ
ncbi:unnamed protein product [Clavelina lepadiformis]|uniref:Uncharacterized protein n=1 Tax=Clavelina lepadiformis TaxID=159417 RepID=A0ABP0F4T8_CLALP